MKIVLVTLCVVALGLTILPPLLFFAGGLEKATLTKLMFAGMLLWFAAAIPLDKWSHDPEPLKN